MANLPEEPNINKINNIINPFKNERFCIRIGAIPTNYTTALNIEDQILYLIHLISNNLIPAINNDIDTINQLIDEFLKLYNFVNDYFKNLDVTAELTQIVNNLVEQGLLKLELSEEYDPETEHLVLIGIGSKNN